MEKKEGKACSKAEAMEEGVGSGDFALHGSVWTVGTLSPSVAFRLTKPAPSCVLPLTLAVFPILVEYVAIHCIFCLQPGSLHTTEIWTLDVVNENKY